MNSCIYKYQREKQKKKDHVERMAAVNKKDLKKKKNNRWMTERDESVINRIR